MNRYGYWVIDEVRHPDVLPSTLESHPGDHCAGRLSVLRGRVRATTGTVRYVEVSTDSGTHWDEASLTGENIPGDLIEWEHPWTPLEAMTYRVLVRITDSDGEIVQSGPLEVTVGD